MLQEQEERDEQDSYEKRIHELEQRLADDYLKGQRNINNNTDASGLKLMKAAKLMYLVRSTWMRRALMCFKPL